MGVLGGVGFSIREVKAVAKSRNRMRKGLVSAVGAIALMTALLPLMPMAQAGHTAANTLEVTPEEQTIPFGTDQATLIARLGSDRASNQASESVQIDFENEGDADGASFASPDASCTIPADAVECSIIVPRGAGRDYWRAWIDRSPPPGSDIDPEVDTEEDKIAVVGPNGTSSDCDEPEDPSNACIVDPLGPDDSADPGDATGCNTALVPEFAPSDEPDCTDVVWINWAGEDPVETTIDCDDETGPDTERETNAPGETETYTCQIRDQFGGLLSRDVFGEVENSINDPDVVDGASYNTPDYVCEAATQPNRCEADVSDVENELGTSEICWWFGEPEDGASLCADEPTAENQVADGSDTGNDLADQTDLTYETIEDFTLDCSPETASNPAGTSHTVTCSAFSPTTQQPVSGVPVDVEITGAGDTDPVPGDSKETPDRSCTTGADGSCSFTHSSTATGTSTYRAWIDADGDNLNPEADNTEGRDENATPGGTLEPDRTDVVEKTWTTAPTTITISPQQDSGEVGECNPYTITASTASGPVQGVTIDVEQFHQTALDQSPNNEPTVTFCMPASGANPSDVDTDEGDLKPAQDTADENADEEDPDNPGTAGGETVQQTNASGQVTIGIAVQPGNGSDGQGGVAITAFFDPNDNDDPDSGEPQDEAGKTWTEPPEPGGRTIECEPETATTETDDEHVVTCTVRDSGGNPDPGKGVDFSETGQGEIVSSTSATTDANGEASVTVASDDPGEQTITGTLSDANTNEPDTDECDRAAGDPAGSPAGQCTDSVSNTWIEPQPECSDGEDNDGDGQTDFPDDSGCDSAEDDDESDEECPNFEGDPRNQIVGTSGDDNLQGTPGDDIICGLGGNDLIEGGGGNDLIFGGSGNDRASGGDGNDRIFGGAGKDDIRGNSGNDELRGGGQNDVILGNAGEDQLFGGGGEDIVRGGKNADFAKGGKGDDTLQGGRGGDELRGNAGNDTVRGVAGHDLLKGGRDDDSLRGGKGNDRMRGGPGRDSCRGGPGSDDARGCEA